jgi:hypothetical protein
MKKTITIALGLCAVLCRAQTTVNGGGVFQGTLRTTGTNSLVDFSGAGSTTPVKAGLLAARPTSCTAGQMYFATDATAGQNLSLCAGSPGTWTSLIGGGGGGASPGAPAGSLQTNNGSNGLAGQAMIYANILGGGTEKQLGMNCTPRATIPFTALTAAATTQQIKIATVPAYWFPSAMLVNELTQFISGSGQVSGLSISIGTTASPSYYVQPLPLMHASPNYKVDNVGGQPASLQSHDVYIQVNVTNVNPGNLGTGTATNLTAGALEVAICGGTWQ